MLFYKKWKIPYKQVFSKNPKIKKKGLFYTLSSSCGPCVKSDLKTASGIKTCTFEVILHAQEVAFGHPGCPLTCKSQFLMIEFFYGYVENWPPVLLRSAHDTRQWMILRMKRAFSLATAQRCTKWYPNMAEQEAEQLRNSSRNKLLATM